MHQPQKPFDFGLRTSDFGHSRLFSYTFRLGTSLIATSILGHTTVGGAIWLVGAFVRRRDGRGLETCWLGMRSAFHP